MKRWAHLATIYGLFAVPVAVLYWQLKGDNWSNHDLFLCFGALAAVSSLGGFFIKPSERRKRYADMLGTPATSRGRITISSIWLAGGLALIGAAFLSSH